MYTVYQFIAVLIVVLNPKLLPIALIDIIRASCIIVAGIITYLYYHFGYDDIMKAYANMFDNYPKQLQPILFPLVDFIVHYLVIFLVGLPTNPLSILYAGTLLITWFEANKDIIPDIYPFDFTIHEYKYVAYTILPIIIVVLLIFTLLNNKIK
jgi:hypothetical protein